MSEDTEKKCKNCKYFLDLKRSDEGDRVGECLLITKRVVGGFNFSLHHDDMTKPPLTVSQEFGCIKFLER